MLIIFAPPQPSNQQLLAGLVAMPTRRTRWLGVKPIQTASLGFFSRIPFPSRAMRPFRLPCAPRDAAGGCQHRGDAAPAPSASSEAGGCHLLKRRKGGCVAPSPRAQPKGRHLFRLEIGSQHVQPSAPLCISPQVQLQHLALEVWKFVGFLPFFFFYMPLPRRES